MKGSIVKSNNILEDMRKFEKRVKAASDWLRTKKHAYAAATAGAAVGITAGAVCAAVFTFGAALEALAVVGAHSSFISMRSP